MEKILTIKDKILAFLGEKGIKRADFFEATGIQSSNFKGKNMSSQPGGDMLVKILSVYPDLSADWLLRDKGEMLNPEFQPDKDKEPSPNDKETQKYTPQQEFLINKIAEQAEEIGRLKARIEELERRRGDSAGHAQSSDIANVG